MNNLFKDKVWGKIALIFIVVSGLYFGFNQNSNLVNDENSLFDLDIGNQSKSIETIPDGWSKIYFTSFASILLPPTLEVRDSVDGIECVSVDSKTMKCSVENISIEDNKSEITIQPQGLYAGNDDALDTFARIIIEINNSSEVVFPSSDEVFNDDMLDLFKQTLEEQIVYMESLGIEYSDVVASRITINGIKAARYEFSRESLLEEGSVNNIISIYIMNTDQIINITASYLDSDSDMWKDDFEKVLSSFSFDN